MICATDDRSIDRIALIGLGSDDESASRPTLCAYYVATSCFLFVRDQCPQMLMRTAVVVYGFSLLQFFFLLCINAMGVVLF